MKALLPLLVVFSTTLFAAETVSTVYVAADNSKQSKLCKRVAEKKKKTEDFVYRGIECVVKTESKKAA